MTPAVKKPKTSRELFEAMMRRYWSGISLERVTDCDEYKHVGAQVGWEAWQRAASRTGRVGK